MTSHLATLIQQAMASATDNYAKALDPTWLANPEKNLFLRQSLAIWAGRVAEARHLTEKLKETQLISFLMAKNVYEEDDVQISDMDPTSQRLRELELQQHLDAEERAYKQAMENFIKSLSTYEEAVKDLEQVLNKIETIEAQAAEDAVSIGRQMEDEHGVVKAEYAERVDMTKPALRGQAVMAAVFDTVRPMIAPEALAQPEVPLPQPKLLQPQGNDWFEQLMLARIGYQMRPGFYTMPVPRPNGSSRLAYEIVNQYMRDMHQSFEAFRAQTLTVRNNYDNIRTHAHYVSGHPAALRLEPRHNPSYDLLMQTMEAHTRTLLKSIEGVYMADMRNTAPMSRF